MQAEIRQANGQGTTVDMSRGDLRAVKVFALAAVHWARLHPEVPLNNLSVGAVTSQQGRVTYAFARSIDRSVRFNSGVFGTWDVDPEAFGRRIHSEQLISGDPAFALAHIAVHELDHLRHYSRLWPGHQPPPTAHNPNLDHDPRPTLKNHHGVLDPAEKMTDLWVGSPPINPKDLEEQLGTYSKSDGFERTAESGAHLHLYGEDAPPVAKRAGVALGDNEAVMAAAPALRQALTHLTNRIDPSTGKRLNPVDLFKTVREELVEKASDAAFNALSKATVAVFKAVSQGVRDAARWVVNPRADLGNPWLDASPRANGPAGTPAEAAAPSGKTATPTSSAAPAPEPTDQSASPSPAQGNDGALNALRGLESPKAAPARATEQRGVPQQATSQGRKIERGGPVLEQ